MTDLTPEVQLLALVGGTDAVPPLTSDELAQCLLFGAVPDEDGLFIEDPHWVPTYDLNRAAASAWRLKAAKVASDYTITIEGRELNRSQMIDNFLKLAKEYKSLQQPRYSTASGALPPWRV
jgi:hypothetical protein